MAAGFSAGRIAHDYAVGTEPMDVPAVLEKLNAALALQYRSVLQYSIASGGLFGPHYLALADRLAEFAAAELADARLVVEKIAALGGEPTTEVAAPRWSSDSSQLAAWLSDDETEAIATLREVIPSTGTQARSEALEHLVEHLILRKQHQLDFLLRATRG